MGSDLRDGKTVCTASWELWIYDEPGLESLSEPLQALTNEMTAHTERVDASEGGTPDETVLNCQQPFDGRVVELTAQADGQSPACPVAALRVVGSASVIAGSVAWARTSPPLPASRPRAAVVGQVCIQCCAPLRTNLSIDSPRVRASPRRPNSESQRGGRKRLRPREKGRKRAQFFLGARSQIFRPVPQVSSSHRRLRCAGIQDSGSPGRAGCSANLGGGSSFT